MPHDESFLAQQKERLLQEKARLEDELQRIAKEDPLVPDDYDATAPDYGRHPEENAQEQEDYESRRGVEQSLELHLREVHQALERLSNGTYGRCATCSETIEENRLAAFPAAATCIRHA